MKKITQEMIHIFKMTDFDWMGYELTKEANYFTFHHIIKKEHGGKEKINNGAILIDIKDGSNYDLSLISLDE